MRVVSKIAGVGLIKPWQAYSVAVVATMATLAFRSLISPQLGDHPALMIFTIPIMLSGFLGGLGPGLLATVLSCLAASVFVLPPLYSLHIESGAERWQQFFVGLAGIVVSGLSDALHRARYRARLALQKEHSAKMQNTAMMKELNDLRTALNEHAAVAISDAAGRITFANDRFCAISSFSRADLLGKDHGILNSGSHPPGFFHDLYTKIQSGGVWHGEIKNRNREGHVYWVDATIVPFMNAGWTPRQYIAIFIDISALKIAKEEAARLAAIVESSSDAIVSKDLNSRVTSWNRGAQNIFGYTAAEMIGQLITRLIPAERRAEEDQILDQIRRGKDVRPFDTIRQRKDGSTIDVSVTVSAIRDPDGRVIGASKIARDVTEAKQAAETIAHLNADLEKLVEQRTSQLENANRELEAFSYSVSHDLRAPLRAVHGFAQAVTEDYGPQLPEEGRRYLGRIQDGARRMGTLIDDLLSFSRLSRQPLKVSEINTTQVVQAVWEDLAPAWQHRHVNVIICQLPPCRGDPALLRQVWSNLLSNALKYTGRREQAEIEVGSLCQGGDTVFFVRDNGTGFDMRYVDKLFGVFQRLHRAEDYEGTGVGLAIVQRIVHRSGGRVWADAAVDRGATFYFTLQPPQKNE